MSIRDRLRSRPVIRRFFGQEEEDYEQPHYYKDVKYLSYGIEGEIFLDTYEETDVIYDWGGWVRIESGVTILSAKLNAEEPVEIEFPKGISGHWDGRGLLRIYV